jgi:hypothetical protein
MNIIERLLTSHVFPLLEHEVINLLYQVRQTFLNQPMLLEIPAPINICGKKGFENFISRVSLIKFNVFFKFKLKKVKNNFTQ